MPRRLVPVVLDGNVETGNQLPISRIGEIVTYAVSFCEATEYTDPDDPRLVTVTARVENGRQVHAGRRIGTPFEQRALWASNLHADGWAAQWTSLRPPPSAPGPLELQGRVTIDFGAVCGCWVRGRVSRLWFTYARRDRVFDYWDRSTWEPVWGSQGRIELQDWPATVAGWPALPARATESGRMIELDLDAVPDGRTGGTHCDPQPLDPRPRPGRPPEGGR